MQRLPTESSAGAGGARGLGSAPGGHDRKLWVPVLLEKWHRVGSGPEGRGGKRVYTAQRGVQMVWSPVNLGLRLQSRENKVLLLRSCPLV